MTWQLNQSYPVWKLSHLHNQTKSEFIKKFDKFQVALWAKSDWKPSCCPPCSWCQRCPGRLVPRSAETPLVKGCIEKDVDKLRNVTALPKYAPILPKFRLPVAWCVLSSAAYSLNWTIPLMMTNRPWYTRRYASLHGRAVFPFESARARQMSWRKLHSGERFMKCLTRSLFFDSSVLRSSYAGTNEL